LSFEEVRSTVISGSEAPPVPTLTLLREAPLRALSIIPDDPSLTRDGCEALNSVFISPIFDVTCGPNEKVVARSLVVRLTVASQSEEADKAAAEAEKQSFLNPPALPVLKRQLQKAWSCNCWLPR
jgi:hypothetical protein